jgi:hypothetical protein
VTTITHIVDAKQTHLTDFMERSVQHMANEVEKYKLDPVPREVLLSVIVQKVWCSRVEAYYLADFISFLFSYSAMTAKA